MAVVVVNKTFKPLFKSKGSGRSRGSSQPLTPILDSRGRPLSGPVGSAAEKAQTAEANTINLQEATQERVNTPTTPPVSTPNVQTLAVQQNQAVNVRARGFGGRVDYDILPVQRDAVRSVDLATRDDQGKVSRVGGVTFRGQNVDKGKVLVKETPTNIEVEVVAPQSTQISPQTSLSPNYNDPLVRQTLPAGERIKVAYKSVGLTSFKSGGSPINIRGGIRALTEVQDIILEKINFQNLVPKNLRDKQVSSRYFEDFAISSLILSPTTSTTAQIEKSLFEVAKVNIAGATSTSGNTATTAAKFIISKGGTNIQGVVVSKATLLGQGAKGDLIIAAAKARTFTRGISFPTGKEIVKATGKPFLSGELAIVRERAGLFFTRSFGKADDFFKTGGISKAFGNKIIQVGATITKSGQRSFSKGLFKVVEAQSANTFTVSGSSGATGLSANLVQSSSQNIKVASSSAAQATVRSIIPQAPKQSTSIVSAVYTSSIPKTSLTSPSSQQTTATQKISYGNFSISKLSSSTSSRTRQTVSQRSVQLIAQSPAQEQTARQIFRQVSISTQVPKLEQRFRQLTKTFQQQQQTTKNISKIPSRTQTIIPKRTFFVFTRQQTPTKKATGGFNVFVRRRGKFNKIGSGLSSQGAFNLGTRATQKGLSQSFKITGNGKQKMNFNAPKGYYSKKSKQGNIFIEQPRTKINTGSEKFLLNIARRRR